MKSKIFLFFGPPGSGKGTLSKMCVDQFDWLMLSTGDLCREHIANQTPLGTKIQQIIASGQLVSDDVIASMVVEWIEKQEQIPQGIVFDGYPRTKQQAEMFYNFLQEKLSQFELIVVKLNIDAGLLVDRILNRVICSNKSCAQIYSLAHDSKMKPKQNNICDHCKSPLIQRADDTKESLKQRLNIYYQHEQEILNFYVDKGLKVGVLQGSQAIQRVFEDFKKIALQDYVC